MAEQFAQPFFSRVWCDSWLVLLRLYFGFAYKITIKAFFDKLPLALASG
jgi:hypothetical protein